jgi:hypothetical protein
MRVENPDWPKAMATVTSCTYDAGAGQALAFGVPVTKHFVIRFNYWANDELHEGEFRSEKAVPQGTLFPVRYDPASPHLHEHAIEGSARRGFIALGVAGSVVLSLAWLFVLRGCGAR